MSMFVDIKRIPEGVLPDIQKAVEDYDYETLTHLHNIHNIGDVKYCCPQPFLVIHYEQALTSL